MNTVSMRGKSDIDTIVNNQRNMFCLQNGLQPAGEFYHVAGPTLLVSQLDKRCAGANQSRKLGEGAATGAIRIKKRV